MTEGLIETGIEGLDLILGGGIRVLERVPSAGASTTLLLRGGAGVGKTVLATRLGLNLAAALDGDVVYAGTEILPVELAAQLRELTPPEEKPSVLQAPFEQREGPSAHVFAGLLDVREGAEPDEWLGQSLFALLGAVEKAQGRPRALVVDALSSGYGLGEKVRRELADALTKLAAQRGLILLLVEEATAAPSDWAYVVDIALELAISEPVNGRSRRELRVTKNRFGPFDPGRHELEILQRAGPRVLPHPGAYLQSWAKRLVGSSWPSVAASAADAWDGLSSIDPSLPEFRGTVTCVTGHRAAAVRKLAGRLGDVPRGGRWPDLIVDLRSTVSEVDLGQDAQQADVVIHAGDPFLSGHQLVAAVVRAADRLAREGGQAPRRILMGDAGALHLFAFQDELVAATLVLVCLLRERRVPLVLFVSSQSGPDFVSTFADVLVEVSPHDDRKLHVKIAVPSAGRESGLSSLPFE